MRWRTQLLAIAALAATPRVASADTTITPLTGVGSNAVDSFFGWSSIAHVAAVGTTVAFTRGGPDHNASLYFREHASWGKPGIGAEILGYVAPTAGTAMVYLVGRVSQNDRTLVASYALIQATALTLATVTTLKFFTGRAPPDKIDHEGSRDVSHSFRFGLGRGGIIDGWPSGHTAVITAMATTLASYYRDAAVTIIGATMIAYTGFSMVSYDGGTVHWLSDVVAGFLIALPIGINVGRSFRARLDGEASPAQTWSIAPIAARGALGLSFLTVF